EVPTNVEVTPCSANPYSFRPAPSAARSVSPSCAAKERKTPKSVAPGAAAHSASEPRPAVPGTSSAASSALEASVAAFSASCTMSSTWLGVTPERATIPTPAVPSARRSIEITVRERVDATPLVVSVFPAQRRFAVDDSSAITTVSPPGLAAASARSTVSWGVAADSFALNLFSFLGRVEDPDLAEQRGGRAVAHRGNLPGLALAAVEGAAEQVRLRAADRLHRVPEVSRRRLVGDVLELPVQPAVPDPEEPLPGELEVVALHVDRPRLVAEDVDAVLDPRDQVVRRRPVRGGLQGHVGHPLQRHVAGGVGERAPVGPAEALELRHPAVQLVADEHAVLDQVPGLPGDALVVEADGGEAMDRRAVADDVHDR